MSVKSLSGGDTITFDLDGAYGNLFEVSGNMELKVFGFFEVSTYLSFKTSFDTLILDDGSTAVVASMGFSKQHIDAFAGIDGFGFDLQDVSVALAIVGGIGTSGGGNVWVSLEARANSVSFKGIDGLTVSADTLNVQINSSLSKLQGAPSAGLKFIDYTAKSLTIANGTADQYTFNSMKGELIKASGNLTVNLFDFVRFNGSFSLEKSVRTVVLDNGSSAETDLLMFGGNGIDAFAGVGSGADRIGFDIQGLDFGFALFSDRNDPKRQWTAIQGAVKSAGFVGIPDLDLTVKTLDFGFNLSPFDKIGIDYSLIDLGFKTSLPSLPDLNWGALPSIDWAAIPPVDWPSIPGVTLPSIPFGKLPSIPGIDWSAIAIKDWISIPNVDWSSISLGDLPSIPGLDWSVMLGLPSLPDFKFDLGAFPKNILSLVLRQF